MRRVRTFRMRLEPKHGALCKIRRVAGCRRYVYNRLLAERQVAWMALGETPSSDAKRTFNTEWSYFGMNKMVTAWRKELDWLADCPVHALQNAAKDLFDAYRRWWKGLAGPPKFRKKSQGHDSWRESDPACFGINGQAVRLPKIGWVRARISRKVVGKPLVLTVKEDYGNWFVTITMGEEIGTPEPNGGRPVGQDLGVKCAVVDSDGGKNDLNPATERERKHLKYLARAVSRKKKGSKNREKSKEEFRRAQAKIGRRVVHEIHVLTCRTAKTHGLVAIEDLNIKGMTASAAGTVEKPGRCVAAKRGLNREIRARRWGEIRRQYGYKCGWYGSNLIVVPAAYSSQECSKCGHVASANRQTRDRFRCVACGHEDDADVNAAKVIRERGVLAAGHAATACGEGIGPQRQLSKKQEPTRRRRVCVT